MPKEIHVTVFIHIIPSVSGAILLTASYFIRLNLELIPRRRFLPSDKSITGYYMHTKTTTHGSNDRPLCVDP